MQSVPLHHDIHGRSTVSRGDWTVRSFEQADEHGVNDLFNRVFGKSRPIEEWKWKFERHPGQLPPMITVATSHGHIVGMYPCTLGRWKVAGEIRTVAQPVETAIEQRMRGGRLITALHEDHIKQCRTRGIAFSYGTPTEGHARLGQRRLGYTVFTKLPILRLDLNGKVPGLGFLRGPLKRMYLTMRTQRHGAASDPSRDETQVRRLVHPDEVDERFDRLWQRSSEGHDVAAIRDAAFLRWRYFERPCERERICLTISRDGELAGYLMLVIIGKKSERVAMVADFLALSAPALCDLLVRYAVTCCAKAQVDYLLAGALPHMEIFGALQRAGFAIRKAKPICMTFKSVDPGLFEDPTRWYFTLGDFDFDEA